MMSRMPRACCRASPVHIPTASKTQRSSVVDVLDMFSNSQGAPHKVTKAWNGTASQSYMARYLSYIYLSKLGRFRCRFAIRCRVHWGQVRWMECSTSETQVTDGFLIVFFGYLKWQLFNFYTLQALQALLGITPSHARKVQLLQSAVHHIQYMTVLPTLMLHVWCYKYEKFITPRQDIEIVNQVSALLYCTLVFVSAFLQSLPSQDPRHQPCWLPGPPEPSDVSTVLFLSSTPYVESMETETLLRPTSCFVSQQKHMSHHEPKPMKTWRIGYRPGSQCSKERQRALERPDLCRFQLIHVDSRIRRLYRNIARQDAASPRNGTRTRTWHQRNQWVMWFGPV